MGGMKGEMKMAKSPPESAYPTSRSLLYRHFLPVCTALFPFKPALKFNTPKEILNSPRVFSITPRLLEPTLVASALMVAIANIKGNNCKR